MKKVKVVIAGGLGYIGSYLTHRLLLDARYQVVILTTRPVNFRELPINLQGYENQIEFHVWSPKSAAEPEINLLARVLEDAHWLINLAGYSIGGGRLDQRHLDLILDSRLDSISSLAKALALSKNRKIRLFQASAIGFYGSRGDLYVAEELQNGNDVIAKIVARWEEYAQQQFSPLVKQIAIGRIGLVMAKDAELIKRMILPIQLGVGGPLGSGDQWYSWISTRDVVSAILFLLQEGCTGIFNLTASKPLRQKDIVKTVAKKLSRPAFFPTPVFALKLALGAQVVDLLILKSIKVSNKKLQEAGFSLEDPYFDKYVDLMFS